MIPPTRRRPNSRRSRSYCMTHNIIPRKPDGEILFQSFDSSNDDEWHNYATVGIEDYDHTTGLEYTYANLYPDAAAPLANNRAIKFTTDPPDTFFAIQEFKNSHTTNSWLEISPNPFKQITNIRCQITDHRHAELKVYDASGRMVNDLSGQLSVIGHPISVRWDGKDHTGKKVAEGVYFVRLQTANLSITRKVILVD